VEQSIPDVAVQADDHAMKIIKDVVLGRIVEATNPFAVVLFGSRARGDHRPTSDVDLLIIARDGTRAHNIYRLFDAHRVLRGITVPTDIIATTPALLADAHGNYGSVLHWTGEQGVALYEAEGRHFVAMPTLAAEGAA